MKKKIDVFLQLPQVEIEAARVEASTTWEALGRLEGERLALSREIKELRSRNSAAQGVMIQKGRDYRVKFTLVRSATDGMKEFLFPAEEAEIRALATESGRMDSQGFLLSDTTGDRVQEEISAKENGALPPRETGPIVEVCGMVDIPTPVQPKVVTATEGIDFSDLPWDRLLNVVTETLDADNQVLFKSDDEAHRVAASVIFLYQNFDLNGIIEAANQSAIDGWIGMTSTPPTKTIDKLGWKVPDTTFDEVIDYIQKWKPVFPVAKPAAVTPTKAGSPHIPYLEAMYKIVSLGSYEMKLIRYWNSKFEDASVIIPAPESGRGNEFPKATWVKAKACLDKWKVEIYDKSSTEDKLPPGPVPIEVHDTKEKR